MDLTPRDWAKWALLGNDKARVPVTLEEMVERITNAIEQYASRKAAAKDESE